MQILEAHLANCESYLLAISKVPSVSGHSLHKGTPREAFIREFLSDHLPADLAIGNGELIDYRSEENEERNQHDVVIFESSFPRIHFGGGINAYLRESAVATVEVKSTLDAEGTLNAIKMCIRDSFQTQGPTILTSCNYPKSRRRRFPFLRVRHRPQYSWQSVASAETQMLAVALLFGLPLSR